MISIIIPVYNREKYIEECIRSIQAQTYKNYEIILIDDGSTDNTLPLCQAMAEKDPSIRILAGAHAGVSAARNVGLEAVAGAYVFFLDSDDVLHPRALEILVQGLKETDAAISATARIDIGEKNWQQIYAHMEKYPDPWGTTYQTFEETLEATFGTASPLGVIGGVMMRSDLIGSTRFRTDLYIGEDFFFVYENMIKGGSTVFSVNRLYYARHHDSNLSWDFGYTGFMNRLMRRELVWKSEEALGRKKYAVSQKNSLLGIYQTFRDRKSLPKEDLRKINKVMRSYRKEILPDLMFDGKLRYILYFWIPGGYYIDRKCRPALQKLVRKLRGKKV